MKSDKLTEFIFAQQLVSVMNRTKWRELAHILTSNEQFIPNVRVGYVNGYEATGFARLDWEWVKFGDSRVIKWLEIDPIKRENIGRLIEQKTTDFSEWVRISLLSHSIPFTEIDSLFRIDGYLQPSNVYSTTFPAP
jgi:hypothetical protein